LIEAINPGVSRAIPPYPSDAAWQRPTGYLGRPTWHAVALCEAGWHRRLVPEEEYIYIVGQQRRAPAARQAEAPGPIGDHPGRCIGANSTNAPIGRRAGRGSWLSRPAAMFSPLPAGDGGRPTWPLPPVYLQVDPGAGSLVAPPEGSTVAVDPGAGTLLTSDRQGSVPGK
jgi:hypothetical protein